MLGLEGTWQHLEVAVVKTLEKPDWPVIGNHQCKVELISRTREARRCKLQLLAEMLSKATWAIWEPRDCGIAFVMAPPRCHGSQTRV